MFSPGENRMQDNFMKTKNGRKIIWDDVIKFVRNGGLYTCYTNTEHGFIHWSIVASYMEKYPSEMELDELICAIAYFRARLIKRCLKSLIGETDRVQVSLINLLLRLYMPNKDTSDTMSEGINKIEETRLSLKRLAGEEVDEPSLDDSKSKRVANFLSNSPQVI